MVLAWTTSGFWVGAPFVWVCVDAPFVPFCVDVPLLVLVAAAVFDAIWMCGMVGFWACGNNGRVDGW